MQYQQPSPRSRGTRYGQHRTGDRANCERNGGYGHDATEPDPVAQKIASCGYGKAGAEQDVKNDVRKVKKGGVCGRGEVQSVDEQDRQGGGPPLRASAEGRCEAHGARKANTEVL